MGNVIFVTYWGHLIPNQVLTAKGTFPLLDSIQISPFDGQKSRDALLCSKNVRTFELLSITKYQRKGTFLKNEISPKEQTELLINRNNTSPKEQTELT